jgi:hypothetical protein
MVVGIMTTPIIKMEITDAFSILSKLKREIIAKREIEKSGCPSTEMKFAIFAVIVDFYDLSQ